MKKIFLGVGILCAGLIWSKYSSKSESTRKTAEYSTETSSSTLPNLEPTPEFNTAEEQTYDPPALSDEEFAQLKSELLDEAASEGLRIKISRVDGKTLQMTVDFESNDEDKTQNIEAYIEKEQFLSEIGGEELPHLSEEEFQIISQLSPYEEKEEEDEDIYALSK